MEHNVRDLLAGSGPDQIVDYVSRLRDTLCDIQTDGRRCFLQRQCHPHLFIYMTSEQTPTTGTMMDGGRLDSRAGDLLIPSAYIQHFYRRRCWNRHFSISTLSVFYPPIMWRPLPVQGVSTWNCRQTPTSVCRDTEGQRRGRVNLSVSPLCPFIHDTMKQ